MDRLSTEYQELLISLKQRIHTSQIRAALAVNNELILLYWQIGREILLRQSQQGWGAKVIDRLSQDLRQEFPELKGLSRTNLLYMRAFAEAYSEEQIVQQVVGQIPWGHNLMILDKVKDLAARRWYAQQVTTNGWSRNILAMQIQSQLYQRQGQAVTNFEATLPPNRSDLVRATLKDPYLFDFLSLGTAAQERELLCFGSTYREVFTGTGGRFCIRRQTVSLRGRGSGFSTGFAVLPSQVTLLRGD